MKVYIAGHAIDRASQRLLGQWAAEAPTREPGLHGWLLSKAEAAIGTVRPGKLNPGHLRVTNNGIDFVFMIGQYGRAEPHARLMTLFFRSGDKPVDKRDGRAPRACRLCGEPDCDCPIV